MKIKQIQIRYFRSIYNQSIDVGNLNIFVGLNDSGKSNLLKALNLFFNNETGWKEPFSFQTDFNLTRADEFLSPKPPKDAKEIIIKILFEKYGTTEPVWEKRWRSDGRIIEEQYDAAIRPSDRKATKGFKNYSKVPSMLSKISYLYVPALKGPEFVSHLIGKVSNVLSEKASKDIRMAAAGFEASLAQYLQDITQLIKAEMDIHSLLKLPPDLVKIFENMEFSDQKGVSLTHRGDGVRTRHIPILLDKISKLHRDLREKKELYDHFIWGYEEPENNVELSACFEVADRFFDKYSKQHQIFISTHSPAFYGLPERHNVEWKQSTDGVFRYVVNQKDRISTYNPATEDELDPYFLLPAISRHMEKAHQEIEQLKKDFADLEAQQDLFDKPCIFVEGESDKIIFDKAVELFFPQYKNLFNIVHPETSEHGGGANFVKDYLIIWECKQKHLPPNQRIKAIGYFDEDSAGEEALQGFKAVILNSETAFGKLYKNSTLPTDHLSKIKIGALKASVPYTLETLYSPKFWATASENNWLEEKTNKIEFMDAAVISELTTTNKTLDDLFDDIELKRYITHQFIHEEKTKAANYIKKSKENLAKDYLYYFERIINTGLKKIGIIT